MRERGIGVRPVAPGGDARGGEKGGDTRRRLPQLLRQRFDDRGRGQSDLARCRCRRGVVSGGDLHLSHTAASPAATSTYPTRRREGREGEEALGVGERGDEAEGGCWSHGLGEMIVRWLEDRAGLGEVIGFPFLPPCARAGGGDRRGEADR